MNIIIEEIIDNVSIEITDTPEYVTIEIAEMGIKGDTGESAYQSALEGGFIGTEEEFNTFLSEIGNKVDKVEGYSLSENDFTDILKATYNSAVDWILVNGTNLLNHVANSSNPHNVTASQVGLGNVNNTSDENKPISISTATALVDKVDKVDGERLINSAEIVKLNNQSGVNTGDQIIPTTLPASDVYTWAKQPLKPTYSKSEIGLSNVDNTSDANKPISTATQTALSNKADLVGGLILQSQLPSYVDDIINGYLFSGAFYNEVGHTTVITGEIGKIYIDITTGQSSKQYRYTGTIYIQITNGLLASTNDLPEGANNLYFTVARFLSNLTLANIINALGFTPENSSNKDNGTLTTSATTYPTSGAVKAVTDANATNIALKQNTLSNPITGAGSQLDPNTYALQDGTILYHSVKWFVPTGTVSTSGTTVTSIGVQFTIAMVGAKLIINGEWRIITAFTSTTVVTVNSSYSVNYSGVVAGNWGVYGRSLTVNSSGIFSIYSPSSQFPAFSSTSDLGINAGSFQGNDFAFFAGASTFSNAYTFRFSSTSLNSGTKDLGLRRNAAGVLEIYDGITADGAVGNRRDLLARNITSSQFKLTALNTAPASATATGVLGEIRYDANYMYLCTATNTWKRSALTTW